MKGAHYTWKIRARSHFPKI